MSARRSGHKGLSGRLQSQPHKDKNAYLILVLALLAAAPPGKGRLAADSARAHRRASTWCRRGTQALRHCVWLLECSWVFSPKTMQLKARAGYADNNAIPRYAGSMSPPGLATSPGGFHTMHRTTLKVLKNSSWVRLLTVISMFKVARARPAQCGPARRIRGATHSSLRCISVLHCRGKLPVIRFSCKSLWSRMKHTSGQHSRQLQLWADGDFPSIGEKVQHKVMPPLCVD